MIAPQVLSESRLALPLAVRGKVRDVYEVDAHTLLIVATDRLSAFDHVLPTPIPDKGRVLTRLSAFWFARTAHLVPNHLLSLDVNGLLLTSDPRLAPLRGRAMVVRRARRIDVECVVRGYLAGSAWEEYRSTGTVGGARMPSGLTHGSPLPRPLFTPATKAAAGHDENIPRTRVEELLGAALARRLEEASITLYRYAHHHAAACGLVLADTKFEFGLGPGEALLLIDEALTPDSSRYWDAAAYRQGSLKPFDKQFVRDYLTRIGWNREPPAPPLPPEVVAATTARYREVYRRLVGEALQEEGP